MARRSVGRGKTGDKRSRGTHGRSGTHLSSPQEEWLYGRNAVRESLRAQRRRFKRLLVAEGSSGTHMAEIHERADALAITRADVPRDELDLLLAGANHQGVGLLATPYPYAVFSDLLPVDENSLYLVLDSLQDPQNLGTVLRTAEAVGVRGVVIPEHRAVNVRPSVVNASAGAVEHLRVAQVVNLARALRDLKEAGVWVVGLESGPNSVPLWQVRLDGAIALVAGSEGSGVRRLVLEQCDTVASLPLLGKVESLNASVAASVALYEALRQRP